MYVNLNMVIMFVGNKVDILYRCVVLMEEGEMFVRENGLFFVEASAKTADYVEDVFIVIVCEVVKNIDVGLDVKDESNGVKFGYVVGGGASDIVGLNVSSRVE